MMLMVEVIWCVVSQSKCGPLNNEHFSLLIAHWPLVQDVYHPSFQKFYHKGEIYLRRIDTFQSL